MNRKIVIVIGAILLSMSAFSQDPNFHIYLCFGQSNMEGQGAISEQDKVVDNRFQVLQSLNCSGIGNKGEWRRAVPPLCQCWSGLSPADYFGRVMVTNLDDNVKVGVINVAIGGCDIRLFDKDIYQSYKSTYEEEWFQKKIQDYGGNPYKHLIDLAKLAQQSGVIKGILLHQGETNTGDAQWPNYVKKIYNDMLTDLSLNAEDVPLLAGEVVGTDQNGICASMNPIIAKLPDVITTAHVISSEGCTAKSDNVHFDAAGYRELGTRYAVKMLETMGVEDIVTEPKVNLSTGKQPSAGYSLGQNVPNPVDTASTITFEIPEATHVSIKVFNMKGVEVAELAGKEFPQGKHSVQFNSEGLKPGIYMYIMQTKAFSKTQSLVVVKK